MHEIIKTLFTRSWLLALAGALAAAGLPVLFGTVGIAV
jgi:hypothetical protein